MDKQVDARLSIVVVIGLDTRDDGDAYQNDTEND